MLLIELSQLIRPGNCVMTDSTGAETFVIKDRKLYVLVVTLSTLVNLSTLGNVPEVTLSTLDNPKLPEQLK